MKCKCKRSEKGYGQSGMRRKCQNSMLEFSYPSPEPIF